MEDYRVTILVLVTFITKHLSIEFIKQREKLKLVSSSWTGEFTVFNSLLDLRDPVYSPPRALNPDLFTAKRCHSLFTYARQLHSHTFVHIWP